MVQTDRLRAGTGGIVRRDRVGERENMMEIVVNGIPLMLVIVGLVEAAKRLGLDPKRAFILALVLGTTFGLIFEIGRIYPEVEKWFGVVIGGLVVGLAASGLYDLSKRFMVPKETR